jgi:hypothetical protein
MHSARVSSGQKKPPLLRGGGWTLEYLSFSYYLPELLLLFFRLWGCVVLCVCLWRLCCHLYTCIKRASHGSDLPAFYIKSGCPENL